MVVVGTKAYDMPEQLVLFADSHLAPSTLSILHTTKDFSKTRFTTWFFFAINI